MIGDMKNRGKSVHVNTAVSVLIYSNIYDFSVPVNASYAFLVGVMPRCERTRGDDPIYSYQPLNTHGAMKPLHFFLRFPLLSAAFTA
jgi:hypothetical protein